MRGARETIMNDKKLDDVLGPDIDTVECSFGDVQGQLRGKRIPAKHFAQIVDSGFGMADALFAWDHECGIMMEATYTNAGVGFPDMELFPMLDTLRRVPWREGAASVLCESRHPDGRAVAIDPRNVLSQLLNQCEEQGYRFHFGTELEFFLLGEDRNPVGDVIQCYSLTAGAPWEHVMRPLRNHLDEFGIYVEACNTEYAPGQFEMNVRYAETMESADNTLRFKAAVREIASEHDLLATFMPKPFPGESGNGLHVHQSVLVDGANAFADASSPGVLGNELMEHYLAGLLAHMPGLMFLGGTTVNSYKRLEEYSFAPMNATWAEDNRTVGNPHGWARGRPAYRISRRLGRCQPVPHYRRLYRGRSGWGEKRNSVTTVSRGGRLRPRSFAARHPGRRHCRIRSGRGIAARPRRAHGVASSRARQTRVAFVLDGGDRLGTGPVSALGLTLGRAVQKNNAARLLIQGGIGGPLEGADLQNIAVRVVKIGLPTDKNTPAAVFLVKNLDTLLFQERDRFFVVFDIDLKRVVDVYLIPRVRVDWSFALGENQVVIAGFHEHHTGGGGHGESPRVRVLLCKTFHSAAGH